MKKIIYFYMMFLCMLFLCMISSSANAGMRAIDLFGGNSQGIAYGVIWDQNADTYQIGTVANSIFTEEAVTSWPIQEQMRRVILTDGGTVAYYLCSSDSTLKENCSTAAVLDGTDGQVMVQIPVFHYIQARSGDYRYFFVGESSFQLTLADSSIENSIIHPAFTKAGSQVDYRYIGAYQGTMYDDSASAMVAPGNVHINGYASGDKLCSITGNYPKTSETRAEFRAMAEQRGTGWHHMDAYTYSIVSVLYLTEYASFYSQSEIGNGRTALSGGTWIAGETGAGGYIGITGTSNGDGNVTNNVSAGGSIASSQSGDYMTYRGIENWWGNVWQFLDGINIHNSSANGSRLYLAGDYTDFADDTDTNYTLAGSLAQADGYATDVIDFTGIWPSSTGGSSSTYLTDYYYTHFDNDNDSGWRVALVGGDAGFGASAGAFCVALNYSSSGSETTIGGRLCF